MRTLDETHDPLRRSWVASAEPEVTDFPIQNLPFGAFRVAGDDRLRAGVRIGDMVVDLHRLNEAGALSAGEWTAALADHAGLQGLLYTSARARTALRRELSDLLRADNEAGRDLIAGHLLPIDAISEQLPVTIGSFTDFMASPYHAGRGRSLVPNFKHLPIGYNSRASTVRLGSEPQVRPLGQFTIPMAKVPPAEADYQPIFGPSQALDYEAELGAIIGGFASGKRAISVDEAADCIFGYVLLNDWSARDIQFWEMFPLGPFQGKSMGTSISPWIVTDDALLPFRQHGTAREAGDPAPLPYLQPRSDDPFGIAVDLTVAISTEEMQRRSLPPHVMGEASFLSMYWSFEQMIAHHTVGGCDLQPGDLLGSGTVSGPGLHQTGCMSELQSVAPIQLDSGEHRRWLEDHDQVLMRARAHREGFVSVGFGDMCTTVIPADGPGTGWMRNAANDGSI